MIQMVKKASLVMMALAMCCTTALAGGNATKSKKQFTMNDRYSVAKSKEMFLLIQSYHNPMNSIEKAIRSWNGGIRYSVRATNKYYKKVMSKMK